MSTLLTAQLADFYDLLLEERFTKSLLRTDQAKYSDPGPKHQATYAYSDVQSHLALAIGCNAQIGLGVFLSLRRNTGGIPWHGLQMSDYRL